MNPELLYFLAVALCGAGLTIFGVVTYSLTQRVRRLEAKLEDIPVRYVTDAVEIKMSGAGGGAGGILPTIIRETKLPRGRGLV